MRILTANLYNGCAEPDALGRILDATNPDVVAAQEMAPSAAAVIGDRMPHGLLLPALDNTGSGLAAARPMEVRRHRLPHRDALVGQYARDGGRIVIWSVHLANPIDRPPPFRQRRNQVRALQAAVDDIPGEDAVVVVGDLNATPLWPAYRRLLHSLDDGVAEWAARAGVRPERTWARRPGGVPLLRIDHALTRGIEVERAETILVPGSDHRALVVDLA